jgi:hypothetical protein
MPQALINQASRSKKAQHKLQLKPKITFEARARLRRGKSRLPALSGKQLLAVQQQLPFRWQNHGDSYWVRIHAGETIGPGLLKARLGKHQRRPTLLILAIGERKRHPNYR